MAALCSECGGSLKAKRPGSKTCSPACRSKRSRRQARKSKAMVLAKTYPEHMKEAAEHIDPTGHGSNIRDVAHKLLEQELRPVVREAITEDALRAIQSMVGLTPRVVELLAADMESSDAVVRQRAYTLIAKYTLGHQAIVTPESQGQQALVVNFALPRPGGPPSETQEGGGLVEGTAEETQPCDSCGADKPLSGFVAGSTRCSDCFTQLHTSVRDRFGDI